jgi:predicted anti-sigma-YlaC factor YlaD
VSLPATYCARARESISAQLDGELSEPERDRLELHLLVCPECSAWAEEVQGATHWLREAPWEEPAVGFALPRRVRTRAAAPLALVAAAAASLVAVLGFPQSLTQSSRPVRFGEVSAQASAPAVKSLEVQRLGLASLPSRVSTAPQSRFHAV